MKILFLAGGSSIHTVRWVNALSRKGHEVHLAYQKHHMPKLNIIDQSVAQYCLPAKGNIGYYANSFALKKICKQVNPDIVNAHYASGYGTLARVSKLRPLLLSVWGSDVYEFPYESKLKYNIIHKNLLYADKIASTSHVMAKKVSKIIKNDVDDIAVTPFGVDLSLFRQKASYRREKNQPINIGLVKTLSPKYGIDYLVKAFKILIDYYRDTRDVPELKLTIYGTGEQLEELQNLCKLLGIEQLVEFRGHISNTKVANALSELDIFSASSISESFGVSVVEAMAVGLPVVATDADGFTEVVVDGETGIIVPKKDPTAMAKALRRLVEDEPLRIRMGTLGRARVEELYDFDKNVEAMIDVYNSLIL
jgi:glycosyltransferase involved in cell wall biosynthesis